ncbi:MAG: DUF5615 family PIN-like protein [Microthrixaceae bacterium]|nr:DUF5615 family PIN-like protein [Microthrixaceae bacterium]
MRLLFDQNPSRTLVGGLRDVFPESQHVTALGLDTATDREIWDYAGEHGYVTASKDSDFRQLSASPRPTSEGRVAPDRQCVDRHGPSDPPRPHPGRGGVRAQRGRGALVLPGMPG